MVKLKDDTIERVYYSTSQIAKLLKVPKSTIRYWRDNFFPQYSGTLSENIKYPKAIVDKFKIIHFLIKVEEYTISGTKRQIKMKETPETIKEVNDNIIELKTAYVAAKSKLGEFHTKFHETGERTPLSDIKSIETKIEQYIELIDIAKLQKENIKFDSEFNKLKEELKKLRIENHNLKQQLNKNK